MVRVVYILQFDYVESREHDSTYGKRFSALVSELADTIGNNLQKFSPLQGEPEAGDSGSWFFDDAVTAIHAAIHLVENLPLWSRSLSSGQIKLLVRAVVYKSQWDENQRPADYDVRRAIGKSIADGHNMPDNYIAVEREVFNDACRRSPNDDCLSKHGWHINPRHPDIARVGQVETLLRPARTSIGEHHLQGSLIFSFSQPLNRGELLGHVHPEYALDDDSSVLSSFRSYVAELKSQGKKEPYNGRCYRVVGDFEMSDGVDLLPVADITFAHWALPTDLNIRNATEKHICRKLEAMEALPDSQSLSPRHTTPIGVEVALTTSDSPPRLLLIRRSHFVYISPHEWDVSFSGYSNLRDRMELNGMQYLDFWETARREAEFELNGYCLEARCLRFFGLHKNLMTGSMDLLGHCSVQEQAADFEGYLQPMTNLCVKRPREPELEESCFAWVEATPDGLAKFCGEQNICLGKHGTEKSIFMPEAIMAVICTLRSFGYSEEIIAEALSPHCI